MLVRNSLLSSVIITLFLGCGHSTEAPPNYSMTVSGIITLKSPTKLPPDAQVVCVWPNGTESSSGTPITPQFGTCSIDTAALTFQATFKGIPPSLTVTSPGKTLTLGYAHILLISPSAPSRLFGRYIGSILGAVNNTAIVYHTVNARLNGMLWLNSFPQGYAVGTGTKPGDQMDSLVERSNSGLELVVDTDTTGINLPQVIPGSQPIQ